MDYRKRILINLGLHPNEKRNDIRFCNHHNVGTKKIKVSWFDKYNNKKQIECCMNLPEKLITTSVPENNNKKKNKGTGINRLLLRYMTDAQKERE